MLHVRLSLLLLMFLATAQQTLRPSGFFLSDTVRIGEPTQYSLVLKHPKTTEIYFPDSASNFYPFEFISKKYFPTFTIDSISTDSVVYTLRTFEVREMLEMGLPVQVVHDDDTSRIFAIPDQIVVKQYIREDMDSLQLKTTSELFPMKGKINYPYILIFAGIGLLLVWMLYRVFGKTILRNYRLYNMYKNHIQFIRDFENMKNECLEDPSILRIEKALGAWKDYLSELEQEPIYTYTTTEIISLYNQDELKQSLQEIDRYIYKGEIASNTADVLDTLSRFSSIEYKRIREDLQRGK